MFVAFLQNLYHSFHNPGKVFKLRSWIVSGMQGHIDLGRFFYDGHREILLV